MNLNTEVDFSDVLYGDKNTVGDIDPPFLLGPDCEGFEQRTFNKAMQTSPRLVFPDKLKYPNKRTGRGGKLQCSSCRRAKRGGEVDSQIHFAERKCVPDPSDPAGPCTACIERGKECGGRTWPSERRAKLRGKYSDTMSPPLESTISETVTDSRIANLEAKILKLELSLSSVSSRLNLQSRLLFRLTSRSIVASFLIFRAGRQTDYEEAVNPIDWSNESIPETSVEHLNIATNSWHIYELEHFANPLSIYQPTFDYNFSSLNSDPTGSDYMLSNSVLRPSSPLIPDTIGKDFANRRPSFARIAEVISSATPQFTGPVTIFLDSQFQSVKAHISRLRATGYTALPGQSNTLPVVKWRLNDETDVLAIFKVENDGSLSHLTHYGTEMCGRALSQCFMEWLVPRIEDLKELFIAAEHCFQNDLEKNHISRPHFESRPWLEHGYILSNHTKY